MKSLKLLGKKTSHKWEPKDGDIDLKLTRAFESTSRGKIDIVAASQEFDGKYVKEYIFEKGNSCYQSYHQGKDVFMIFDLKPQYYPNIRKILVEMNKDYKCEVIKFYTGEDYQAGDESDLSDWKKLGELDNVQYAFGPQTLEIAKDTLNRYLCIKYLRPKSWLGVNRVRFISEFAHDELDEDLNISLKDVLGRRRTDADGTQPNDDVDSSFVNKYLRRLNEQRMSDLLKGYSELAVIEQTEGILTNNWLEKMYYVLAIPYIYYYNQYVAEATLCSTTYEHNEMIKFAERILSKSRDHIEKRLEKIKKSSKKCIDYRVEALENEYLYFKDIYDCKDDLTQCMEIRKKYWRSQRDYRYEVGWQGSKSFAERLINEPQEVDEEMENLKKELNMENNIQLAYDQRNETIFNLWCDSVSNHPMMLSGDEYSVEHYKNALLWAYNWDNRARHQKNDKWHKLVKHINILKKLFDVSLKTRTVNMHKFHLFTLSEIYGWVENSDDVSRRVSDEICRTLNMIRDESFFKMDKEKGKQMKTYCKWLLCWQNPKYYAEMMVTGKQLMRVLRQKLDKIYTELEETQKKNAGNANKMSIIELKFDKNNAMKVNGKTVKNNLELLEGTFKNWYVPKKSMFYPKDCIDIENKWKELGFEFTPQFADIRRDNVFSNDENLQSIVASDDLIFNFLNCVAHRLQDSFQAKIKAAVTENRERLGLPAPHHVKKVKGYQHTNVKGKSRQNVKMKIKYWKEKHPKCMAVTDIVRCGVVCEDEQELCSLYNMLVNDEKWFKGRVIRVKNAFDDVKKGNDSYGYRAILMNVAHGDAHPSGIDEDNFPFPDYQIACEIQLLLKSYWNVRAIMHLAYNIVRSETLNPYDTAADRMPYYILAQDSCKLGALGDDEDHEHAPTASQNKGKPANKQASVGL